MNQEARVIIVVDDDHMLRRTIRLHLEREGYTVIEAGGANEALEMIGAMTPHGIVTDVNMPDGDGIHLLETLLERVQFVPTYVHSGDDEYITKKKEQVALSAFVPKKFSRFASFSSKARPDMGQHIRAFAKSLR